VSAPSKNDNKIGEVLCCAYKFDAVARNPVQDFDGHEEGEGKDKVGINVFLESGHGQKGVRKRYPAHFGDMLGESVRRDGGRVLGTSISTRRSGPKSR